MNYTPKQRRAIARAFRAAKPYLWDGEEEWDYPIQSSYICLVIDKASDEPEASRAGLMLAKEVVWRRLEPLESVEDWLYEVAKVPESDLTDLAIQQYRHRWLDALIEEFEQ